MLRAPQARKRAQRGVKTWRLDGAIYPSAGNRVAFEVTILMLLPSFSRECGRPISTPPARTSDGPKIPRRLSLSAMPLDVEPADIQWHRTSDQRSLGVHIHRTMVTPQSRWGCREQLDNVNDQHFGVANQHERVSPCRNSARNAQGDHYSVYLAGDWRGQFNGGPSL